MLNKSLGYIAFLIIGLIISMPINSSIALAGINSVDITGSDGLDNIVSSSDSLNIQAEIDQEVTTDDITFKIQDEHNPDNCQVDSGNSICDLSLSKSNLESRRYEVNVFQYQEGALVDDMIAYFGVDTQGPGINNLNLEKSGNYSLTIEGKDLTCSGCKCSGPDVLNIIKDFNVLHTIDINSTDCSFKLEKEFSPAELSFEQGENELCFTAVDKLGNTGKEKCLSSSVDNEKPAIDPITLLGEKGNEIKYISPNEHIETIITANITESNLSLVTGNFSSFNILLGHKYKNKKADCKETSESNYICKWQGILIRGDEGNLPYKITAVDTSGNKIEVKESISLEPDNTGPVIEGIYSNRDVTSERIFLRQGTNKVWVEFASDGAGYENREVYMNLIFGSVQNTNKRAKECIFEKDKWYCYFDVGIPTSTTATEGKLTITKQTKDDAGNNLPEQVYKELMLDDKRPEILEIEKINKCPYSGQDMKIKFKIKDANPVSVTVEPKKITKDNNTYVAECEPVTDNTHTCTLVIDNLVGKHVSENLQLQISDAATNLRTQSLNVEVCEKISGDAPFDIRMDYSTTGKLDRRMLGFVELPLVVQISLMPEEGIQIIEKKANCDNFVKSTRLVNKESNKPLLITRIKKKTANKDSNETELSFDCTLDLVARKGNFVYSQPVTKHLNVTAETNRVGEIQDSIQEKIDEIADEIESVESDIEEYEQYNDWLSMICSIGDTLVQINAVMGLVKSAVYIVSSGLTSVCPGEEAATKAICSAGWNLWSVVCKWTSKYNKYVTKYVWYPPFLQGWTNTGQYIKILCMIYSCKLCTLDYAETYADLTGIDSKIIRIAGSFAGSWYSGLDPSMIGLTDGALIQGQTWGSAAYGGLMGASSAWGEEQEKTSHISLILDGGTMDPYKSIHAARACLCIPGILYNLRKDKQIKCMYRTCLQENAEKGLPTDICDEAYRMRECLYVEGAQWKLLGSNGFFSFFENLLGTIIRNLPLLLAAESWGSSCGGGVGGAVQAGTGSVSQSSYTNGCSSMDSIPLTSYTDALKNTLCHASGAALQIAQVGGFSDLGDFDKYSGELEGDTVC